MKVIFLSSFLCSFCCFGCCFSFTLTSDCCSFVLYFCLSSDVYFCIVMTVFFPYRYISTLLT